MLKKLLLLVFGLVLGAIISYGVLKVWEFFRPHPRKIVAADYEKLKAQLDYDPASLFKFDPDISYMLKENFQGIRYNMEHYPHYTNSLGLLGRFELDPRPQIYKVLFLGDSVTYGHGVAYEHTWVAVMQKLAPKNFQLANGSCPGWSTFQEIIFFKKYLSKIDWKKVIIVFCINDLVKFEWFYDTDKTFKMSAEIEHVGGLTGRTEVKKSFQLWKLRRYFMKNPKTAPLKNHNNTALHAWMEEEWKRYVHEILEPLFLPTFKDHIQKHQLVIISIPTRFQIESYLLGADKQIVFFPQEQLKTFCAKNQIAFMDSSSAFYRDDIAPGTTLSELFIDDLHLSETGHNVVAKYLWSQLKGNF